MQKNLNDGTRPAPADELDRLVKSSAEARCAHPRIVAARFGRFFQAFLEAGPRIRMMAAAIRRHSDSSWVSAFRPAFVRL